MQYPVTHANVGHDPDEDFMKNLGKMRHSKATLKTSQDCNDVDDDEEGGVKWILPMMQNSIQRDLNKLKSVVNIPQNEG